MRVGSVGLGVQRGDGGGVQGGDGLRAEVRQRQSEGRGELSRAGRDLPPAGEGYFDKGYVWREGGREGGRQGGREGERERGSWRRRR